MRIFFLGVLCLFLISPYGTVHAQQRSSTEIVRQAWEASNKGDLKTLSALVDEIVEGYGQKAEFLSKELRGFPARADFHNYQVVSDVATALFVKAELLMNQGQKEEAKKEFRDIIAKYRWAQCFDPSRGAYWSIAEKAQDSIDRIDGKSPVEVAQKHISRTKPVLAFPGTEEVVDYSRYGQFLNVGQANYHYQITDEQGLAKAVGEGIYPNIMDVYKDPGYKKALKQGRLQGTHWDFVNTPDLQAAFYKWYTAPESWGLRLFYLGVIFEKAGMFAQAIKAYDALVVHFPSTIGWTYWQTPWYPGQAALYKIRYLIRMHPELHMEFYGAKIHISNPDDPHHYVTKTNPGSLKKLRFMAIARQELKLKPVMMPLGDPVYYSGEGQVRFVKYSSGHWQLLVDNKPFLIKGMAYMPTKVGQSPDDGTMVDWMQEDDRHDGLIAAPYEAWVDKYGDNKRHPDEPVVGDLQLMKDMGVNTLRIYYQTYMKADKPFLEKMYKEYGLKVALSNFAGKYAIGSGAKWSEGTDYENPLHQKHMLDYIRTMVMEFKDEPYILMWILGNENNYGVASNADKKPVAYFKFINEAARMIKSIDPNHPVAVCNGDTLYLDKFGKYAPDVDAYGANVYRGNYGFGSFWDEVAELAGKPAFITEYGAPAYGGMSMSYQEAQQAQADYHKGNWMDILENSAGYKEGDGNSVGGMAFEWLDEWWKDYSPAVHDTKADAVGPFPGGYYFEEWFGIFGQGNGSDSPYLREGRKIYYTYRELWKS
ncbi:MAG: tetratricopeptide repeat protein [Candidatus Omnitrophica bacterium]|nr:tetratricopeptide repeat protein [Candidatus Omnitrophota bacterium]